MSAVQQAITKMQEKEFDEKIKSLKIQHSFVKEAMTKDTNLMDVVAVMKGMKNELFTLYSKNKEKIQQKNEMVIKLCEQMTYCLLKESKADEALKILQELDVIQDIIKEKNLKAIVYFGRTYLMLKNFKEAHDYFSTAYRIADDKTKKDIKPILDKIELSIKEQDKELNASMPKIGHSCSTLTLSDIQLTPINSQCALTDGDLKMDVLAAKQQVESVCNPKKIVTGTIEICTIKAAAGILAEYTQKSGNLLPIYNLTNTTLESFNKKIFHMSCECVGHTESGSASTKQNAKEKAAHKMLKYLQNAGKLRLTTNLGLQADMA